MSLHCSSWKTRWIRNPSALAQHAQILVSYLVSGPKPLLNNLRDDKNGNALSSIRCGIGAKGYKAAANVFVPQHA